MNNIKNIINNTLYIQLLFLMIMLIYRLIFFIYFNELEDNSKYINDILEAFLLGFRIDLTVIGYIQLPISLFLIIIYFSKSNKLFNIFNKHIKYYFFFITIKYKSQPDY